MIVTEKIPRRYGEYFLALEADDTQEASPRKNIKVVSVSKRKDRVSRFEDIGQEPIEASTGEEDGDGFDDIGVEDTPDDTQTQTTDPANEDDTATFDDINADSTDNQTEQPEDTTTQTTDDTQVTDDGGTAPAEETQDANGNQIISASDGTEEGDTGVDEEGFDDIGGDGTDEGTADGNQQGNQDNKEENQGPGLEYDSTRKYVLFKEFMSLYNSVDNYVSKLENMMNDDPTTNQIYKVCTNNLREIRDLIYDYMTLKYEASRYVQSLLFYEKMVAAVQIVFNMLSKAIKFRDKNKNNK